MHTFLDRIHACCLYLLLWNFTISGTSSQLPRRSCRERHQYPIVKSKYALTCLHRFLLLYPMTSAPYDVRLFHLSASFRLHRFESARLAVDAPIGFTCDEAFRNVDGTAGE